MKKEGVVKILLCSFLFVFLLSGVFAAAPVPGTCEISLRTECLEADGNYILMGLTSSTNAHGQTVDATPAYGYVLCCGVGTGDTTCDETSSNKIIGLSAITNAHGEVPSGTVYETDVCYEDFKCAYTTATSCPEGSVGILSLTSTTNAHIGGIENYSVKICCTSSYLPSSCSFSSAIWSHETVENGARIHLDVEGIGSSCDGESIAFNVYEYDFGGTDSPVTTNPINVAFDADGLASGVWYAEYQDDGVLGGNPEYYFNVSRVKNKGISMISSDPKLTVSPRVIEDFCSTVSTCGDYTTEENCESDAGLCGIAEESSVSEDVSCSSEDIVCGCSWDTTNNVCEFGYTELDAENCGNPTTGCTFGCSLCKDTALGTTYCNLGSTCKTGDSPAQSTPLNGSCDPGIDGCGSADCDDGEKDTCATGLYCLADKCSSVDGPPLTTGKCLITQTVEKDCETEPVGYKTITWTGTWSLPTGSGIAYDRCIAGGTTTIPCPAQIQLPFFDYSELIITVAVIALIYVSLIFRRKFAKKAKVKGKK